MNTFLLHDHAATLLEVPPEHIPYYYLGDVHGSLGPLVGRLLGLQLLVFLLLLCLGLVVAPPLDRGRRCQQVKR